MAEQTYIIHISGYWRDLNKSEIRKSSGIYFVYESFFDERAQTIDLLRLLYVGEAENVRARIMDHESYVSWLSNLGPGKELCYAFAPVDFFHRERVKAAFVITHKPPANINPEAPFLYDKTTLVSTGRTALVNPVITVKKDAFIHPGAALFRQRNEMIPVRTVQDFNFNTGGRRYAMGE
jgi:hypothetical protein